MTEPSASPDSPQESFISHLIELRSRLLRSIIAVVVVLLCLFPWAKDIYAALARPLLKALPQGSTMIATDVTGTLKRRLAHELDAMPGGTVGVLVE